MTDRTDVPETPLRYDLLQAARYYLAGRRGLVLLGAGVAIPAIWLGWPWLLAAGIAPILISLAPCLIMCGLGLCMMRSCGKQAGAEETSTDMAALAGKSSADRHAEVSQGCSMSRPAEAGSHPGTLSRTPEEEHRDAQELSTDGDNSRSHNRPSGDLVGLRPAAGRPGGHAEFRNAGWHDAHDGHDAANVRDDVELQSDDADHTGEGGTAHLGTVAAGAQGLILIADAGGAGCAEALGSASPKGADGLSGRRPHGGGNSSPKAVP